MIIQGCNCLKGNFFLLFIYLYYIPVFHALLLSGALVFQ